MVDRQGQRLGNYRLVRQLGEGGFAEVYLGEHIHLNTPAAIKVLHAQLNDQMAEHFRNEARTIAQLVHPNIVRILDFGVEGSLPFLVMDYAPNGTLRSRYPQGIKVPMPTVITYVKEVASALQYAHDRKLVHRDVKPENMLIGRNNELLLSDFGIAIVAQSTRHQGTQDIAGTISYMAPEQIQAHPRPSSDQYALAMVVYEWLSGRLPFEGTWTEIAIKQSMVAPEPLRGFVQVSPQVDAVVMRALQKDPTARFATIREFAVALEHAGAEAQQDESAMTYVSESNQETFMRPWSSNQGNLNQAALGQLAQSAAFNTPQPFNTQGTRSQGFTPSQFQSRPLIDPATSGDPSFHSDKTSLANSAMLTPGQLNRTGQPQSQTLNDTANPQLSRQYPPSQQTPYGPQGQQQYQDMQRYQQQQPNAMQQPAYQQEQLRQQQEQQRQQEMQRSALDEQRRQEEQAPRKEQPNYFPLVRNGGAKDLLIVPGYVALFLLLTYTLYNAVPEFQPAIMVSPYLSTGGLIWAAILFPVGALLAGKLLGSIRGAFTMVFYALGLIVLSVMQYHLIALRGLALRQFTPFLHYLGLVIAALVMGWFYEFRRTQSYIFSALTCLIGALIVGIGMVGLNAISTDFSIVLFYTVIGAIVVFVLEIILHWLAAAARG